VNLDAGTVDEQPVGCIFAACQGAEDAFPDAALGPADEAIVDRLLWPVDASTVTPTSAALEGMNDPTQYPTVINPLLAPCIGWQQRLDARPLSVGKPKEISHLHAS
jgi:hypothetical protein